MQIENLCYARTKIVLRSVMLWFRKNKTPQSTFLNVFNLYLEIQIILELGFFHKLFEVEKNCDELPYRFMQLHKVLVLANYYHFFKLSCTHTDVFHLFQRASVIRQRWYRSTTKNFILSKIFLRGWFFLSGDISYHSLSTVCWFIW